MIDPGEGSTKKEVVVKSGYCPGIIGWITQKMHVHMHTFFSFNVKFETRIACDIAEFFGRIESSNNQSWYVEVNDQIVGSISIDGEDLDKGIAHLRWFVVDSSSRSSGVGYALLSSALEFCDQQKYSETHLWTVKGLDDARKLYEKNGFFPR